MGNQLLYGIKLSSLKIGTLCVDWIWIFPAKTINVLAICDLAGHSITDTIERFSKPHTLTYTLSPGRPVAMETYFNVYVVISTDVNLA